MNYTYNFEAIPGYIVTIMNSFPVTLEILLISLVFSLGIGALVTVGSLSSNKVANSLSKGWISFMRGIPTLVLIFLLYLGLPQIMLPFGINMSRWNKIIFIIATLSMNTSANMAEMMRAAYLAVDKGQLEAGYSVGMSFFTAFRRIIFPQAFGIAIPMLGNNIVNLFKETSLAFTIGVVDILGRARAISGASYGASKLETYIASGITFWIICIVLEQGTKLLERVYTKGRKRATS